MSGDSNAVWFCLVGGILLQLTYMILPFQRWDWARYLGSAILPVYMLVRADYDHHPVDVEAGLIMCGFFAGAFALFFQKRLLPRLGEGSILMWTAVLMCVISEFGAWRSAETYWVLGVGLAVIALLVSPLTLSYPIKLAIYAWFLAVVVTMGVLQFRASDFTLMIAGRSNELDYRFVVVDGMAGAYIAVHAAYLLELLPILGKHEKWADFKVRWLGYLDLVASRFDVQRLDTWVALALVFGIGFGAFLNHKFEVVPDRTLASLVLFALPIAWRYASILSWHEEMPDPQTGEVSTASPGSLKQTHRHGIGQARHSRKHRREQLEP
jgi:hypothetical protein